MKKLKKILFFILPIIFIYNVSAFGWYTKITKDHSRPEIPSEIDITKHGGIAIGEDQKKIYLTFDAGYENGNVQKVADVLKKNDVKAAFFILSNIVETNPELIKQLEEDGHLICNHTRRHPDMSQKCESEFKKELTSMEIYFKEKTGRDIDKFYRPPEGKFNADNLKWASDMGYKTIFWSVAYKDWDNENQMTREKALDILLSRVHNGAVVLLHPTSNTNAEILDEFIKTIKEEGYEFGRIDDIKAGE